MPQVACLVPHSMEHTQLNTQSSPEAASPGGFPGAPFWPAAFRCWRRRQHHQASKPASTAAIRNYNLVQDLAGRCGGECLGLGTAGQVSMHSAVALSASLPKATHPPTPQTAPATAPAIAAVPEPPESSGAGDEGGAGAGEEGAARGAAEPGGVDGLEVVGGEAEGEGDLQGGREVRGTGFSPPTAATV